MRHFVCYTIQPQRNQDNTEEREDRIGPMGVCYMYLNARAEMKNKERKKGVCMTVILSHLVHF